jgi:hypothetical protein
MKVLVYMKNGSSWATSNEIVFTKEHPYQLIDEEELIYLPEDRFSLADKNDVIKFYEIKA